MSNSIIIAMPAKDHYQASLAIIMLKYVIVIRIFSLYFYFSNAYIKVIIPEIGQLRINDTLNSNKISAITAYKRGYGRSVQILDVSF